MSSSSLVNDILTKPGEWPSSVPIAETGTRVLTYVFKNEQEADSFVKYVDQTYPIIASSKVVKDDNGIYTVSVTQYYSSSIPNATDDSCCCPSGSGCWFAPPS